MLADRQSGRHGSSPRVRGTRGRMRTVLLMSTVHPRGCGERFEVVSVSICEVGSSPRVRGTRRRWSIRRGIRRFIPAGAGNA